MTDARACAICGVSLAGRRRHARCCSGACRAEASRRIRAESAPSAHVRFPGEPQGEQANSRRLAADGLVSLYGGDAATAGRLLASGASEFFLRRVTQFHLRKRGRPSGPDDVAAVIASLRSGTAVADSSAVGPP